MKILIAGGGTGGHLFPALAVADTLKQQVPEAEIAFVGTDRGLEARLIPTTDYQLFTVPVYGLSGTGFFRRILALTVLPAALNAASRIVREFAPDLVIGVGGYASAPVLFASGIRRIPRVILEQNAVPGLTNRIFGPSVEKVLLSFEVAKQRFKTNRAGNRDHMSTPGNPVRAELLAVPAKPFDPQAPHLLVFGGSQGAEAINDAMLASAKALFERLPNLTITHQTGKDAATPMKKKYAKLGDAIASRINVVRFIDDMAGAYAQADLVLCRAGATSVAELTTIGRPSILVPYPHATHDHQNKNAAAVVAVKAAILLPQSDLPEPDFFGPDPKVTALVNTLSSLLGDGEKLQQMTTQARTLGRPNAADDIVRTCLGLLPGSATAQSASGGA